MMDDVVLAEIELMQMAFICFALLLVHEYLDSSALRRCSRTIRRVAKHRRLCIALVGLAALGASIAMTAWLGIPVPCVHDEFSYLLAADTFALGRLTNPPHLYWEHFEAVHINQRPTYHSVYPPGQGIALAMGLMIGGHPIVGVWLSMGLACAAVCWMLQAWCPPQWALMGGVLAVFRFVFMRHPGTWISQIGYWSHSYWGGAVAMLGGALVFGGLRRIVRRPCAWDAAIMGLGLAILANSRPFEGFIASLPVAVITFHALWHRRFRQGLWPIVIPLTLTITATVAWMAYFNVRTTGCPLLRPYDLNANRYAVTPSTLLQSTKQEPEYRHQHLRKYYVDWAQSKFLSQQTDDGYFRRISQKAWLLWAFYFGVVLSVPMVALPWVLRNQWAQFAVLTCVLVLYGLAIIPWCNPHYLAPIAPLLLYLEVRCLRVLWLSRWPGRLLWRSLAAGVPIALMIVMPVSAQIWSKNDRSDRWFTKRQQITEQLMEEGGEHLVLVSSPEDAHTGWVYNAADIDSGAIVWANDMGAIQNSGLLEYYRNRKVWLVDPNSSPLEIKPYERVRSEK